MANVDHSQFQFAAERYVLDELSGQELLQFEEHFFVCEACSQDVEDLIAIRDAAPAVLPGLASGDVKGKSIWTLWRWMPQTALAALGLLAVFAGYQNLVEIPRLKGLSEDGLHLAPAPPRLTAKRSAGPLILPVWERMVPLLIENEWPDKYERYEVRIGRRNLTVMTSTIPGTEASLLVTVPAARLGPGDFDLIISGISAGINPKVVARYPFTVQETSKP